ncbi:C-type LECtin [Caenorhabditis elegans]|uniref:C-type LECtin n=1 Tax=Caenorhabditis elegans TaxID=6239 RepID=Q9NAK6_CAEEL|nr:C-type LECtin [Caenorhabditis elegans]CAB54395.2 C-type LECtin [Caenorhabditis elegans]|eukprot:NP_496687.2 C-type LECtin [Caenorhabditis elegans]
MQLLFQSIFLILLFSHAQLSPVCSNGYTLVNNNKCLRLFKTPETHKTAELTCLKNGGATLANIKSSIDNRAITIFVGGASNSIWIGLFCTKSSAKECFWDDDSGSADQFQNFKSGFPLVEKGRCVYSSQVAFDRGQWSSGDCEKESRAFVCELPVTNEDQCQKNYNGYCYFDFAPLPFVSAQKICKENCGIIASILSPMENRYINANFYTYSALLIGATWSYNSSYTWFDGSSWSYHNIDHTARRGGVCLAMSTGTGSMVPTGSWYPVDCKASNSFLCKRPAGTSCPWVEPETPPTPVIPSMCNSSMIMAPGTISSPAYPGYYDNNMYCSYLLSTTGAYNILLKFTDFSTNLNLDYVTVYDGETTSSPMLGSFSGFNETPINLVSTGNTMLVTFRSGNSEDSNIRYGFSATFSKFVQML